MQTIYQSDAFHWYEYIKEHPAEFFEEDEIPTEDEIWGKSYEMTEFEYEDIQSLLNKKFEHNIICFADLGLWDGRRKAHKIMGCNLKECISGFVKGDSNLHVYIDGHNLCAEEAHHDGTNYYVFKVMKKDINSMRNASYEALWRNCRSLRKDVKEIFEWR